MVRARFTSLAEPIIVECVTAFAFPRYRVDCKISILSVVACSTSASSGACFARIVAFLAESIDVVAVILNGAIAESFSSGSIKDSV